MTFDEFAVGLTDDEREKCVQFLAAFRARRTIEVLNRPRKHVNSDDLVARLRRAQGGTAICEEAAAEIERLRSPPSGGAEHE
jgi:hypothetical protein